MPKNTETLDFLFTNRKIDLRPGKLFDLPPSPLPASLDWERVEGMMLGLAIGDSLGRMTEGWLPDSRKHQFGEIRDYLPNQYAGGMRIGVPSDDTQLAFWTLEQMITDRGLDPGHLAQRFSRGRIFGIGSTVRGFLRNFEAGKPWYECGPKSAGNGALMRIAPMLIPHLKSGTTDLWADTALSAMVTHNDSASISACLSLVDMLWQLLQMDSPPANPRWWVDTYVKPAKDLEVDMGYKPRSSRVGDFEGPVWKFVETYVPQAFDKDLTVRDACDLWYSAAYLLETVPCVVYILMRHGHDPEEAIIRAVNDTKDNDTIAAIVGAAVGALHGRAKFPSRWISNLSGRTGDRDDGRIFELLREAQKIWG